MARNEHKKVLQQLSEAYEQIHEGWEQKVGEVGSRIAGAFKRKKKEPEGKEEQPTPEDKPKVSRGAGHGIDRKAWSADVDPDDISAKRKSGESYERRKMHGLTTKEDKRQLSRECQMNALLLWMIMVILMKIMQNQLILSITLITWSGKTIQNIITLQRKV